MKVKKSAKREKNYVKFLKKCYIPYIINQSTGNRTPLEIKMIKILKKLIKQFFSFFNLTISKKKNYRFPIEADKEIIEFIKISKQFSMTDLHAMYVLSQAILKAKTNKLDGDFVECGIWRGGNVLLLKLLNDYYKLNKSIFAFDTFDGMTAPSKFDIDFQNISAEEQLNKNDKSEDKKNIHCYSELETVKKNISKYTNLNNIKFVKGPVEKTLLDIENLPEKISILRLDTDFYESTKIELNVLYPKLVQGGVLIIDDYGHWKGAQKAVDEFFDKKEWLHIINNSARYLIKE